MFYRLFKTLNLSVKSHDFRHAKLTELGTFLTAHQVRDYAGHSSIKVTDAYLHSNQEEVLKKVADAYKDPAEARKGTLPRKRVAKAENKLDARAALQAQKGASDKTDKNDSTVLIHSVKPLGMHDQHSKISERTNQTS